VFLLSLSESIGSATGRKAALRKKTIEIKTTGSSALAFLHSLGELLELLRDGAAAELIVVAEHPLARSLRGDAAEDHAVQQRVAAKTVVAVHAAGNLASRVQARDGLALLVQHGGVAVDLKATHAVVDHGCDDGDIEGLALHSAARDHIVVELFAAARLAADLVPRLARGVCGPAATVGVLLRFLGGLIVRLVRLLEDRHRNAHIRSQSGTTVVVLHDTTAGVVLAMPLGSSRRPSTRGSPERSTYRGRAVAVKIVTIQSARSICRPRGQPASG